ncbi:O-antigen ligase family protein [Hymenobacter ruricola]|uniref:O-antigen ligase family protein n=1 Tax=Hymenobacter ruricola TaxID=2791023 RepID=A0ABS0I4W8_9BACT|nr:O-antigen ligase family protein [Hymenobacter ruricola]MBF9221627.1 O-antigen ligase family protein [Hymenobacter ruricola]
MNIPQYYSSGRLSQYLLWLACVAGVVGLLAARFLVALAPVVGVLAVLANPDLRRDLPRYFRNGAALRAAAIVVFLLLSSVYTSEWAVWRHEVFRSLPWVGVPLAFAAAVPLASGQRLAVGALFVLGTAAVGLLTLGQYLLHPEAANEAIRIGQNMQAVTRVFHISFGLMLAQAFFWGLLLRRHALAGPWLRRALLAAAVVAVVVLHVLAYRTGLLVLYAGLLAYAGWLLTRRNLALGLGLVLVLGAAPWLAYQALPSVQKRVGATVWDVQQFQLKHDINNYSLARRLAAIETAGHVISENWLVGVGPADTHAAMLRQYAWHDYGLQLKNRVEVHNQYLEALMGGGLIGLGLWLAVLLWPLTRAWGRRNPAICFFILTQATVMMVVDTLSLQIGLNLFVFGYGFLVVAGEEAAKRGLAETNEATAAGSVPRSFAPARENG